MSVRPTQTKSGYPRRSRQPYPSDDTATVGQPERVPEAGTEGGPVGTRCPGAAPGDPPQPASRVPIEGASGRPGGPGGIWPWLCGLVVAVCLVLTILIVDMARTRP